MKTMTIKEIAMAVGIPCRAEGEISEICTDTRAVTSGCLFVAIRGERFDGNDFADEAIRQGAGAVLCERKGTLEHGIYLVVKDTRTALLRLAEYYAGLFSAGKWLKERMRHGSAQIGVKDELDKTFGSSPFRLGILPDDAL